MTSKYKSIIFAGSLVLMLSTIGMSVLGGPSDDVQTKDINNAKRVAKAAAGDASDSKGQVAGNGVVEPDGREVKVAAPLAGRINSVDVKEGDRVQKDALLATLDASVEKAALAAAEADLQSARAEMARTLKGLRREDVDAAVEEARAATARAEQSKAAADRIRALAAKGGATPDELDKASATATADQATAKASEARMRAATNGARTEDVVSASARAEAARARRDQAKAAYDRLFVRSPIDGEVLQIKFRPGEYYVPGGSEPLLIVGDTRKLTVRMDVDERDVAKLKPNAHAIVTSDAMPGKRIEGRVLEIGRRMGRKNVRTDDPTERKDTKILEVVIALDDSTGLVPGQRVVTRVDAQ